MLYVQTLTCVNAHPRFLASEFRENTVHAQCTHALPVTYTSCHWIYFLGQGHRDRQCTYSKVYGRHSVEDNEYVLIRELRETIKESNYMEEKDVSLLIT